MRTNETKSMNHAILTGALTLAAAALAATTNSTAQQCQGGPVAGTRAEAYRAITLSPVGPNGKGDNIVHIPAFSPVNDPNSGFKQLCDVFGLTGTGSTLHQIDASTGAIRSHACDDLVQVEKFQPCQAVLIRPDRAASGIIPVDSASLSATEAASAGESFGVDGTWQYPIYNDSDGPLGDHLYGVPLNAMDVDGDGLLTSQDVCDGLGLKRSHSQILKVDAASGAVESHTCGKSGAFAVKGGQGLIIRSDCARSGLPGSLCQVSEYPVE